MARVVTLTSRTDPENGVENIPVNPLIFMLAGVPLDACEDCAEFQALQALGVGEEIDVNEEVHAIGVE